MMMKFRSKKAFTLVEMIVTVAVLSITAGVGVGVFVSVLRNYSHASVLADEQQKANEIEKYISEYARRCGNYYFITSEYPVEDITATTTYINKPEQLSDPDVTSRHDVHYITIQPGSDVAVYAAYEYDELDDDVVVTPEFSVDGVESIEFSISRQDFSLSENSGFTYLNYTINMEQGYSLTGSVVMYNVTPSVEDETVGARDTIFKIGKDELYTKGIAFVSAQTSKDERNL